jgi:hypothetical protein
MAATAFSARLELRTRGLRRPPGRSVGHAARLAGQLQHGAPVALHHQQDLPGVDQVRVLDLVAVEAP